MFKHILIATDGSKLSNKAVKTGINLARSLGAKVTAFYASPDYPMRMYGEGVMFAPYVSRTQYLKEREVHTRKLLEAVQKQGAAAQVAVELQHMASNAPYEAILRVARRRKCDLIVMASHGRRGVSAMLLGSETQKVLTHSKVAALVVR